METPKWKWITVFVLIVVMIVCGYVGERVSNPTTQTVLLTIAIGLLIAFALGLAIWFFTDKPSRQ